MPRRRQAPAGPRRSAVPCRPIRCASHPLGSRRPLSPLAGALASPRPVIPPSPVPGMPGDGCPSCQRRRRWLPAVTIAPAAVLYASWHESDYRSHRPAQAIRADRGPGRTVVHGHAGRRHRLRRPQWRGKVHHDAGDPRPGRCRRGQRADRRAAVPEPAAPSEPRRSAAGRGRPAAEPDRSQPPALAGPLPGPDRPAGRRGHRAGRPPDGRPAQGRRLLAGHAAAARHRGGDARRPAGAHAGRAVQRPGSGGHRVDAGLPAIAGRRGPRRPGLQPPDERAPAHRRPVGGDDGAGARGRHRGRHRSRHAHRVRTGRRARRGAARRERGAVFRGVGAPRDAGGGLHGAHPGNGRVPRRGGGGGTMTTGTATPYRSQVRAGRDGFAQLLRAEWTKFRTVRGWVIGMVTAALVTVLVGLLGPAGSSISCSGPGGQACKHYIPPVGPGGEPVTDSFYFVRQALAGDGSITVRVTSLTGLYGPNGAVPAGQGPLAGMRSGTQPWSKAGIIIKESTSQGSAYAALMVTGGHGVRMQYDYTHDLAGLPGAVFAASPRWLRLTRSGDAITGYASADGAHWTRVGTASLAGLSSTVQAGLFVASPEYSVTTQSFGGTTGRGGPTQATARFDHVSLQGTWPGGTWTGEGIGGETGTDVPRGGLQQVGGGFTVSGSGDIAPKLPGEGLGRTIGDSLVGAFAGLIAVIVVATLFITAEYRRGLIRTTLAASPRRGRVLAAKAIVIGSVTFVTGLVAAVVTVPLVERLERAKGFEVFPVTSLMERRVVVGTAALLAVAAVLALGVGTVLRRSAGAVTGVIVLIVLPYILAVASVLPAGASEWLLRLTPAAAFAIQQSVPRYPQVSGIYTPSLGYYPLAPWAGLAVLCGYAALALGLAVLLLRRRDA